MNPHRRHPTAKLTAAALLFSFCTGNAAALAPTSNIEIYGSAHLAVSYLDDGEDYSALNLSSNASRIGFRTGHEFSPALRGVIQIEGQVDLDSNNNTSLTSRDSYGALIGNWGMVRAGYFDTPMKVISRRVDMFSNQVGDTRNLVRDNYSGLQGFDERFRNGIGYRSPSIDGFIMDLHYSVETQSNGNAANDNRNSAVSAALTYTHDGAYLALGHERWRFAEHEREREILRLSGYYDLGDFRVSGLAQRTTAPDNRALGLGVAYRFSGAIMLKSHYYRLQAEESDESSDLLALGVDYRYATNLRFYMNYARMANREWQALSPWRAASTLGQPGAAGETASGLALGTIYTF